MQTSVIELVKQSAIKEQVKNGTHTKRLLKLLGKENSLEYWKIELAENNLYWYITAKDILKFKYHVNLKGGILFPLRHLEYVGDMPDFALDRAELAIKLNIREITLHSIYPLPTKRVHIDPLMVGWLQDPEFISGKDDGLHPLHPNAQGIVLAVWHNDKEEEL